MQYTEVNKSMLQCGIEILLLQLEKSTLAQKYNRDDMELERF